MWLLSCSEWLFAQYAFRVLDRAVMQLLGCY